MPVDIIYLSSYISKFKKENFFIRLISNMSTLLLL